MVDSHTEQQAFLLRAISERLKLEPVKQIIKQPGMRAVYRVTIDYHDRRALDSVATLYDRRGSEPVLDIVYRRLFGERPISHPIAQQRYEHFTRALQKLRFDHLKDQPGMPVYGLDFWMIERAAGAFVKNIIVAPAVAEGVHAELVHIIKTYLPEALREIPPE